MSNTAIHIEGLGKSYMIGHKQQVTYATLRDELTNGLRHWWSRIRNPHYYAHDIVEEFWALRDVGFDVQQGDRLGIIGHNGAGKSTLLKVLSRITEPTTGRIRIRGRIASLLEVGTGFHPELTGRENVFLNGAILGMSRLEVRQKFDEIVHFADIERFLDTPVKRYSSGMYVRLAFAVAAHLEPEILIVDEVLAVGDAQFQNKCQGKIKEVGDAGRTVLFVSHNMAMVSNLCTKGIVLDAGRVTFEGPMSEAVLHYYERSMQPSAISDGRYESDNAQLLAVELAGTNQPMKITIEDDFVVRIRYRIKLPLAGKCVPNFHFFTADGNCAFVSNAPGVSEMPPGEYNAECRIPRHMLNEGTYFVNIALTTHFHSGSFTTEFINQNALTFNVVDPMDENSDRYNYRGPMPGAVRPRLNWHISRKQ